MTIEEILAGESRNVEFKVERPKDYRKYMKTVIAFANGKGGRLIFGVEDQTRRVVGIPEETVFQEMDAIANAISDSCEPIIIPDIYLQTVEGKTIIVAEISPGRQRPYYIKADGVTDGVYIRISGTSRKADRTVARELYYESEGRSYDSVIRTDLEISEEDIQKLCTQMKEVALSNSKNESQRQAVKDVTKNVLLNWGVLAEAGDGSIHPTNAYIFLTGQDAFLSKIQCGMFKGTTRAVFVDKRDYGGPLWEQIEEAFRFALRNIHLGAKIEGIYRKDIYELPPDSIRELIINAVMNCSFLQPSHIQVAIYDDRLEITSPGGLMPGVTVNRMKEGYSQIRNRALAHAFSYMNLIEGWGTGIPRLLREMKEYGLPEPEFVDMEIALRINLYRSSKIENLFGENMENQYRVETKSAGLMPDQCQNNAGSVPDYFEKCRIEKNFQSKQQEAIYNFIEKNGQIVTAEVEELLGVKQRRARKILKEMVEGGLLRKKGAAKNTHYMLTERK